MLRRFATALLTAGSLPCAIGAQAPNPVLSPDSPTCPRCTIEARVVATIGTADGPGALSGSRFVLADGRNRYWTFTHDELPVVFDEKGSFVRQIGRMGPGPGELEAPMSAMLLPGDSVLVFGRGQATLVGPDFVAGRTIRLPGQLIDGVPIGWPSAIMYGPGMRLPAARELPLHRVTFDGPLATATSHFGWRDTSAMRGPFGPPQQLSPASAGGAWAAEVERYRITRWTADGEAVVILQRKPDWFADRGGRWGSPTTPPSPGIAGVREDSQTGYLWVFLNTPAPTWREAWPPTRPGAMEVSSRSIAREKLYTTTIEVLDPATRTVIATGSLKDMVTNTLPGNRVATYVVDADGIPHINIVALALVRR